MGKDHIWNSTKWDRETGPKDHRIQHSWDRETRPKDHIWDSTQLGQGNRTQRPYMGKDHIWDSTQWDKETRRSGPKDHRIQHSWDRETRPKDHIRAKTIYGIQHSGTRKPDPNQRPYLDKDHIWDSTQWDKETGRYGPKDHRIQHSWDRKTRPKDHIWAKTIYGIQHSGTRKPDPKTIGFNTVGTGKPDPKTIYGQRPYMGFNTVGQGNRTQTKDHIWAKTIWDLTQWDKETRPKDSWI